MLDWLWSALSPVEIVAAISGLLCVWLTMRQDIRCWPVGLVQTVLYVWLFYGARLYSDVLLQVVFIGMQLYGWWFWLHGGPRSDPAPVRRLSAGARAGWLGASAVGVGALGTGMDRLTQADLPYWDATTTVLSLAAQWLLGRKVLESWALWITVDVLCVGIYAVKGLYVTSALYAIFLGMAIGGLLSWNRGFSEATA